MRAPFQILAIPYRVTPELQFCVFHRADIDQYQFVAGGGENDEKPVDAAIREICEETSINTDTLPAPTKKTRAKSKEQDV